MITKPQSERKTGTIEARADGQRQSRTGADSAPKGQDLRFEPLPFGMTMRIHERPELKSAFFLEFQSRDSRTSFWKKVHGYEIASTEAGNPGNGPVVDPALGTTSRS